MARRPLTVVLLVRPDSSKGQWMGASVNELRFDSLSGESAYFNPGCEIRYESIVSDGHPNDHIESLYLLHTLDPLDASGGRWVLVDHKEANREITVDDASRRFDSKRWWQFTPSPMPSTPPTKEFVCGAPDFLFRFIKARNANKAARQARTQIVTNDQNTKSLPRRWIQFDRLDGSGMEFIEFHSSRSFFVGRRITPSVMSLLDESTITVYFLMPDRRWLMGRNGYHQSIAGTGGFTEVPSVMVAHAFIVFEMTLPPELEPFRFDATDGYADWLDRQGPGMVGSNVARKKSIIVQCENMPAEIKERFLNLGLNAWNYCESIESFMDRKFIPVFEAEHRIATSAREYLRTVIAIKSLSAEFLDGLLPSVVSRQLDELTELVKRQIDRWGWGYILEPHGEKAIEVRIDVHKSIGKNLARRAAWAWQKTPGAKRDSRAEQLEMEAKAEQLLPLTLPQGSTAEEAESVYSEHLHEWATKPIVGSQPVSITQLEREQVRSLSTELEYWIRQKFGKREEVRTELSQSTSLSDVVQNGPDNALALSVENDLTRIAEGGSETHKAIPTVDEQLPRLDDLAGLGEAILRVLYENHNTRQSKSISDNRIRSIINESMAVSLKPTKSYTTAKAILKKRELIETKNGKGTWITPLGCRAYASIKN